MIYLNQGALSSLYLRPESDTSARRVQRLLVGTAGEPQEVWLYPTVGSELANWNGGELVFGGRGVLYTNNTSTSIDQNFIVPAHVGRLHLVAIGAGGSGSASSYGGTGGGGGALATLLNVPVMPGDVVNLTIGAGGTGGLMYGSSGSGQAGGNTVISGFLIAGGGQGGAIVGSTTPNVFGGAGGIPAINDLGARSTYAISYTGIGGKGGDYHDSDPNGSGSSNSCGGGGAGGYGVGSDGSGAVGGAGGGANTGAISGSGTNGAGGGGGSCGGNSDVTHGGRGGMGGGAGPFGKGTEGAGVLVIEEPATDSNAFQIGNEGLSGSENSTYTDRVYGGGSGGMDTDSATPGEVTEAGQGGAILICWGPPVSV